MKAFILRFWTDESYFWTSCTVGARVVLAFLGFCVKEGWIPTGVDGGGDFFSFLSLVAAFAIPGGSFNRGAARPGAASEAVATPLPKS